ncbi:MAG TPA: hypothetical protein VNT29_06785 [Candidatus Limnocylindrales bacterium]|nr:hypothetical protein [Candidatus Limnocylindrales bacterium]
MRAPLKAGPFRMELADELGAIWKLRRVDASGDDIALRPDELHQLGRVVEKARKYRNTSKRRS